ncbi:oligosaccharide flippase family protein [Citrifermentans bremense]|uniref:oligosaccharide flippase family protein n=1 Tax=Citrifermentans bremense TaxID=60035 RepID=UPI0004068DA8|nr:polysaccharide biosynthesis C-terminal domain-containing protein [Citrifermentans bremense]
MSFAKTSASVFATKIGQIAIALVLSILINRAIGPQNRGLLELLSSLPVVLVSLGHLGIGNANLYFIGKGIYSRKKVIDNSVSSCLILSAIMLLLIFAGYHLFYDSIFRGVPPGYLLFTVALIPLMLFQKYLYYILLGDDKIYLQNKLQIFSTASNVLVLVFFIFVLHMSLWGVILSTFISTLLSTWLCIYYVIAREKVSLSFDYDMFLASVKFGMVPFLALAVMNLIFRSDVFIIKYYLSDAELGYYGLSVSLCERIWILPESISLVVLTRAARSLDDHSVELTARVCRVTLWATLAICAALFLAGPYLIPLLYGNDFLPAVSSFQLLLPGIALISIYLVLHSDLTGRGYARYTLIVFSLCLVANVLLNVLLVPTMGINGSALASSICYGAGSLALAVIYARKYRLSAASLLLVNRSDVEDIVQPVVAKALRMMA